MLKELDVVDKHRTLLVNLLFPAQETIWDLVGWNRDADLSEYKVTTQPLSLEYETEILRLRFSETGPDPQVRVKGTLEIEPTFGDETFQVAAEQIAFMYPHFRDFIEWFRPLFGGRGETS